MSATEVNEQVWQLVDNYTNQLNNDGWIGDMQYADLLEYIVGEANARQDEVMTRLNAPDNAE